ncbi:TorF family putative porin [Variovorax sp. HJSM1_2]|uniref:TorF family putative porin n=1 Tax=Variovorax sp. HJSM1_2 TaxID=3366263 RepID=UPI003BC40A5F
MKTSSALALWSAVFCVACAHAQTATTDAAASEHSLTGNLALVSDYRFRGISQSWGRPAVQGGFDYSHASGWYLGNWNSSVSANSYNNGASLEADLYGGYRFEPASGVLVDLGALRYIYPSARMNSAPATPSGQKYDTTELYAGATVGGFNAKLWYAVTDYFGLNGSSAAYAFYSALPDNGSSRGTSYLELNYNLELGDGYALALHAGHTAVHGYSALSYSDYRVALSKTWAGLNFSAAVVGTDAESRYYQVANSAGQDARRVGKTTALLSVGKTF